MLITTRTLDINSFFSVFLVTMAVSTVSEACGSFIEVDSGATYTLGSPSSYGSYVNCIWLVETKASYRFSVDVTMTGDSKTDRCGDYVQITDLLTSNLLFDGSSSTHCTGSSVTANNLNSTARWLKVQFRSDGLNRTSGFQAILTSTTASSSYSDVSNPIKGCRSFEWSCPNKVCMTLSYRCDGFNDCGCEGDNCDETGCEGLPLGNDRKYTVMLIGGMMGFGLFLIMFFFAFAYETHLRRKALMADPEAQKEIQRKKDEQKRRENYKKAAREKKGRG